MRRRGILHRLIIALTLATFVVASVAGVEENNSREASAESEGGVSDVTTEAAGDAEYEDEEDETEEDVDEYEEELREVAESHEAMSRDERSNSTSGVNHSEGSAVGDETRGTRNFDSREKSAEEEDGEEGSDESMTSNEAISDETEEEREKGIEYKRTADGKSKRVPTVKKELSSQKELIINETTGESPEIVGRLAERSAGYSPGRTREMIDNDLGEEWVQAESLMKLLVRLAKNPERWERAHRLLTMKDSDDDLELSSLDSRKRGYPADFPLFTTLSPHPTNQKPPPKKPKKKKKKKKKPRHPQTTSPPPPILTTQTTPPKPETHWRLVAERLFGPGWSANRKEPTNISKLHYPKSPKLPDHHDKYSSDETRMDYTRKFHFGKVNTHEKGSPLNQHDSASNYDMPTNTGSHVLDYDLPERSYQRPRVTDRYDRYHHYMNRIRGFGDDSVEDYEDTYPDVDYPRHQGLFGKSWRYSGYEPSRSMEGYYDDSRQNFGRYRSKPWTVLRPVIEVDDEGIGNRRLYNKFGSQWSSDRSVDTPWGLITEQRSKIFRNPPGSLTLTKHREINETAKTRSSKDSALPRSGMKPWKASEPAKDVILPKLTMKTWNSLTSDPATWPFKLSGAKPWPKDKNGKVYNPNAELVRKLGLDKQNRMLEKDDKSRKGDKSDSNEIGKATSLPQRDASRTWKMGGKTSWGSPEDKTTWGDSLELGKLTDWNVEFGKPSQSSTWTPKWKQFSYHKVNAGPVAKPGANLDGNRARNAFIAMSAVTPSRFPGNEWRKNDIEETVDHSDNSVDRDDPASQMLARQDNSLGQWIKSTNFKRQERQKTNRTDVLESQLEELRHNVNSVVSSTQATNSQSTVSQATNSTTSPTESTSNSVEHSRVNQKSNHTIK
ncbi:uncharacterized protein LOC107036043 [Diachasma alloeum]|uniref:uncharacterized protein LOC107036043 n=1 Tax=Diachasma alloeum TaxID=454923 RepID=UPI0007382FE5|nr:uncharacterized protein LOC107036043 [Diachasma alloeum]